MTTNGVSHHRPVEPSQRFTRVRRCPICGGCEADARGESRRCSGYISHDGDSAYCSRDEHAGDLREEDTTPPTWRHDLNGLCNCGEVHDATEPSKRAQASESVIVTAYKYRDERGAHLYDVVRYEPKAFKQRAADGTWSVKGVRKVLFKLPEMLAADKTQPVYVVEGEKDVRSLRKLGLVATTAPGGAGKWRRIAEHACEVLTDRRVVVIADRDEPGRAHAQEVAVSLTGAASSVVVVEVAKGKDASDWIDAGATVRDFAALANSAEASPWDSRVSSVPANWYTSRPPSRAWLLRDRRTGDDSLARAVVGVLAAAGGAGKTMLLCQLAVSTATGTPWLGTFDVMQGGRVLLVLAEETTEEIWRRLHAIVQVTRTTPADGTIDVMGLHGVECSLLRSGDRGADPTETDLARWLRARVERERYAAVLLDPHARLGGRDAETANAAATRVVQLYESCAASGASVIVAHHTAQWARRERDTSAVAMRGVTALGDGARWTATATVEHIETDEPELREIVQLTAGKTNYAARGEPLMLRRTIGGVLVPLDPADIATVEQARASQSAAPMVARAAARSAARASTRATRDVEDDACVRRILMAKPDITYRDIRSRVQAERGCGGERAVAAIARVRDSSPSEAGSRSPLIPLRGLRTRSSCEAGPHQDSGLIVEVEP